MKKFFGKMMLVVLIPSVVLAAPERKIASSINIPEFEIRVDGNSYTDLSEFKFYAATKGYKAGGFMYWDYKEKAQEIIQINKNHYVFKPTKRNFRPLTGKAFASYFLEFQRKRINGHRAPKGYGKRLSLKVYEDEKVQFLNNIKQSVYVTTIPIPRSLTIESIIRKNGEEFHPISSLDSCEDTQRSHATHCLLIKKVNVIVTPLDKKYGKPVKFNYFDSLSKHLRDSEIQGELAIFSYDEPLHFYYATLGMPSGFKFHFEVETVAYHLGESKYTVLKTKEYIVKGLDNFEEMPTDFDVLKIYYNAHSE